MLTLRLGWRNLWRNPRRSLISISSVACALVFLAFFLSLSEGLGEQMLENGTSLLLGHVQLHHPDYLPDRNLYDTLGGRRGVDFEQLRRLAERPEVVQLAPRVYGFALLSSGDHSAGAQLIGVDPARETDVSRLLGNVSRGQEMEPGSSSGSIWIGEGLARELHADLNTELAAVTQAADGSLGNELYRVAGILRTGLSALDNSLALLPLQDLQQLLALSPQRFHEVVIRLENIFEAGKVAGELNDSGQLPETVTAQSWADLSPQLRDYLQILDSAYGFLIGFVGLFAALGILNTMLMAIFERTQEIGTVGALGMPPGAIVAAILMESAFLALLGIALGLVASAVLIQPLVAQGLDLSRFTNEISIVNTYIDPVIRFRVVPEHLFWSSVGLIIAVLVASLAPAVRAARLDPAQALAARRQV